MKKIIIIQNLPVWVDIIKDAIQDASLEITTNIYYLDTFEQCLELALEEGELLVICNNVFYGEDSNHKKSSNTEQREYFRDSDTLASMIKKINKKAKVWIYSEYPPKTILHIDGFISRRDSHNVSIKKVIKLIKDD